MTQNSFLTKAPQINLPDLAAVIEHYYDIEVGEVVILTSERDLTARISDRHGREFVFKIANSAEDPAVVEFQNRALQHLESKRPFLPVPQVILSRAGDSEVRLDLDGFSHIARMLTYLAGVPAHTVQPSQAMRSSFGKSLGQLSRALTDFQHPADDHSILWDLKNIPKVIELTHFISDERKRKVVEQKLEHFCTDILPIQSQLRSQVVHNDFHFYNVLLDKRDGTTVSGIIDFGDLVRTPLIYDVAIALSFQLSENGHPLDFAVDFLKAYQPENPLRLEEVDILLDLIEARNALTVTMTEWRSTLYPENRHYILRNNPRSSLALKRYAELDRSEATDVLRKACGL